MNYVKYSFMLILVTLISCNLNFGETEIEQRDISFVASLHNENVKINIARIDSVLKLPSNKNVRKALLYLEKGTLLSKQKKQESAIKSLEKSLFFFEIIDDKKYLAKTHWLIGNAYAYNDGSLIANEHLIKALEYCKFNDDKRLEASIYDSLAFVYYLLNDYISCIGYSEQSIKIYKSLNDSIELSTAYGNLAILYKNIGKFDDALSYNLKSLTISQLKFDSVGIGKTYSNIGRLYDFQGDIDKAMKYYNFAEQNNLQANIINSIPYRNIGDAYVEKKEYAKSEVYYLKAQKIEESNPESLSLNNIYEGLVKVAFLQNDFQKAYRYQAKSDSVAKANLLKSNDEKIKVLESHYLLFKNEEEIKQQKSINDKNKIIFVTIGLLILAMALYFIQKSKVAKLRLSNEKVVLEQKVLRSQMNPHFVFNALSAIQNSLMDNDPIKSATYLSRFAKLIRQNFDFINHRTIPLSEELGALKNYMDTQQLRFTNKFIYQFHIDESLDTDEIQIPPLLMQPFVENAIEHGFKNKIEKGLIIISIVPEKEMLKYTIKDNGKGFDTSKKTTKEHAIDVFKKRMKLIDNRDSGQFNIYSDSNGTTIQFYLNKYENINS